MVVALGVGLLVLGGDLDDGWASNDVVVRWRRSAGGEDNVLLAVLGGGWDGHGVSVTVASEGGLDWASGGDDIGGLSIDALGGLEGDLGALVDWALGGGRKAGEGLDWESWVGGWARLDEAGGEGVDLIEIERDVEWRWEWGLGWVLVAAEVGRVASLNSQDGTSVGQVLLVGNVLSSTEVGADTNTLKDGSGGKEASSILVTEVVGARSGGGNTSGCNNG